MVLEAALTPVVVLLPEASTLAEAPLAALSVEVVAQESFVLAEAVRVWLVPSAVSTAVASQELGPAEFPDTAVSFCHL